MSRCTSTPKSPPQRILMQSQVQSHQESLPHLWTFHCFTHKSPEKGKEVALPTLILNWLHYNITSLWFGFTPATSTISPGTMSRARILWTPLLSARITFPISGSYSFKASIALSAFLSCEVSKDRYHFQSLKGKIHEQPGVLENTSTHITFNLWSAIRGAVLWCP